MVRHPVKRALEEFGADSSDLSALKKHSKASVDNYLVRALLGMLEDDTEADKLEEITADHVETAKQILRQHFVVGIHEWFDVSIVRFEKYLGWWQQHHVLTNKTVNNCHYKVIGDFEKAQKGTTKGQSVADQASANAYSFLMDRHWADVELYHAAKTLFVEQAKLL